MVKEAKTSRARRVARSSPFAPLSGLVWHGTVRSPAGIYIVVPSFRDPFINFQRAVVAAPDPSGSTLLPFSGAQKSKSRMPTAHATCEWLSVQNTD